MRVWTVSILFGLSLVVGCGEGSSGAGNEGGGGAGGETASTSSDGGGGAGGGTSTGSTTSTDSTSTSASSSTTTGAVGPGCETAGTTPISFANDIQPIFSQSCGSTCHLASSPAEGLSLKVGQAYAELVGVDAEQDCNGQKRVMPGSAADSYIVNKLTNKNICPQTKKMPPTSSVSAANRQKIIDWICQGAPNN